MKIMASLRAKNPMENVVVTAVVTVTVNTIVVYNGIMIWMTPTETNGKLMLKSVSS